MSDKDAHQSIRRETHGMRADIDDDTPTSDVKAPNVFERVKEELEAIVETIHPHKETKGHVSSIKETEKSDEDTNGGSKVKPGLATQEIGAIIHKTKSPHHHHKETHGRSDDIDEDTPISEVKGPNVFERAKEELEALVDAFHHKNESDKTDHSPQKGEGCFGISIGKGLEKVCSPFGHKKD